MASIEELQGKLTAATAAVEAARAKGDDDAELAAMEAEGEAQTELFAARGKARKLVAARAERDAKAKAAGAYQVGWYDVAGGLPQIDPAKIPGQGFVIFRDPPPAARAKHEARAKTIEAMEEAAAAASANAANIIDMLCACTILPEFPMNDPAALAYRAFWETTGRGLVFAAFVFVAQLGGLRQKDFLQAPR